MAAADKLKALRIKADLIADKEIGWMEIEADVHDGIATLTGEVTNEQEKQRAEELAYQIEGIHEVVNEIKVVALICDDEAMICLLTESQLGYGVLEGNAGKTAFGLTARHAPPGSGFPATEQFPGVFSDAQVEEDVRERLAAHHDLDASGLEYESTNQIVHLKGAVRTSEELDLLLDTVMNARGVMGISSDVTVGEGDGGTPAE